MKRMGGRPDVSNLMNGRHTGFSTDRLLGLRNHLDVDVDIVLRPERNGEAAGGAVRVLEVGKWGLTVHG